jgi:DNA-binding NarL/FixJ family response regulator
VTRRSRFPKTRKLSQRQIMIVGMIGDGLRTNEIAIELGLSVKTVEVHRSVIMHKTGTRRLAGLIRWGVRAGIITLGSD